MPKTVALAPDVVLRVIAGEALLLKLGAEDVFALNDTGTRVVQMLQDVLEIPALVDALSTEYEVDRSDLERGIADLIAALVARRLVVEAGGSD